MTILNLQNYLETNIPGACVPVDLLRIAQSVGSSRGSSSHGHRGRGAPHRHPNSDSWCGRRRLGSAVGRRGGNIDSSRGVGDTYPRSHGHGGAHFPDHHLHRGRLLLGRGRIGRSRFMSWEPREGLHGSGWGRGRGNPPPHFDDKFHPPELEYYSSPAQSSHSLPYGHEAHQYHQGPQYGCNYPPYSRYSQPPREAQSGSEYYTPDFNSDMDHYGPTYHQSESEYWSYSPGYHSEDYEDSPDSPFYHSTQRCDDSSLPWYSEGPHFDPPRRRSLSEAGTLGYSGNQRAKSEVMGEQPFSLVLDAEGCMDRLYGGYYSGQFSLFFFTLFCDKIFCIECTIVSKSSCYILS